MAVFHPRSESRLSLEIRTKSVEQTLIPLVTQITTLVNHKDRTKVTEKTVRALVRVGQTVHQAVCRFVSVGESIADENPEIKDEMFEACQDARNAGLCIQKLTDSNLHNDHGSARTFTEKTAMVRAARQLLSAITKVLLLADKIIIKQLLVAKDKVLKSLISLEKVDNFTDFVQAFSKFGKQMVQLAHLTGDRQNDLKSERHRAQMGAARAVLEKSTMMMLPSCKTSLRHPDCKSAQLNREGVFRQMRSALDLIQLIVTDGSYTSTSGTASPVQNGDSGIGLLAKQPTIARSLKDFDDLVELTRVTYINTGSEDKLLCALDLVVETTQDFTDSAYTSHRHREKILDLCEKLRIDLQALLKVGDLQNSKDPCASQELETAVLKTLDSSKCLRTALQESAMEQASELFKANEDHDLLNALRMAGVSGEVDRVGEVTVKFEEHTDQLEEVCKLFRHIAATDPLIITAEHNETVLRTIGPLTLYAAHTLATYPNSKIAKDNLDMFAEAWESQINDLSILVKEVNDVCQGKMERQVYLSLPRPGKHGTTTKFPRPSRLDAEVPNGPHRDELSVHLDKIPTFCQQLLATLKASTLGKSATFNKVDSAIQETKNLMNAIAKVVTTCFICATKFNIDYRSSRHPW
ncbi:hypothetical protein ScPMuIL_017044 [Solemya velum]